MQYSQSDTIRVELAPTEQVVVLALGNTEVVMMDDRLNDGASLINLSAVQRAVWSARLRAMADLIERSD